MGKSMSRGSAFYALKEGKNIWCKYGNEKHRLKSVPYGKDFVVVIDSEGNDMQLPNEKISFYIRQEKSIKKEVHYEKRLVLKKANRDIRCILDEVDKDSISVKANDTCFDFSFKNCELGHIPNKEQLRHYKKKMQFKVDSDTLKKVSILPKNTIIKISLLNEDVVFIGQFCGGEMVYCYGDKPEWFNDYAEIFGDYEYRDMPVYK